jgi:hypothetical protein
MQKKTRSILEELDSLHEEKYSRRDDLYVAESRATNAIAAGIRLIEYFEASFAPDVAENLTRKFLNSLRDKDPSKFVRTVRRINAD